MKIGLAKFCNFSQLHLSNSLTYVYCVACLCVFFLLVFWLGICVEVDVDRITILPPTPPSPPDFFSLPTILSLTQVIDSYLKSAHASSWFRCRLAVLLYTLVTLRKVSRRASCKALRCDH